jgi:hypothetical protein
MTVVKKASSLLAFWALVLLSACAPKAPPPPPGMAYIRPQSLRSEMAKTFDGEAMIREVDQQTVSLEESRSGLAIRPGRHAVVASLSAQRGTVLGHLSLGRVGDVAVGRQSDAYSGSVGAALQAEFDSIYQTVFEHQLSFEAVAGHNYKACVMDAGNGYRYWIEDEATRKTVAGSSTW